MAVDKGRVGAVSVRGRMLLLLFGRLFANPRHLWLIKGCSMVEWVGLCTCGGGVQCSPPYRLHPSRVCANLEVHHIGCTNLAHLHPL